MKRVLVITRNFPPLWGGMERLNLHFVTELSRSFDVWVIAPQGAAGHVPKSVSVTEVPLRPLSRFLLSAGYRALKVAAKWRPDFVIAGSGLTAPLALLAARRVGAESVAYFHGLDLAVPHPLYRTFWRPVFKRLNKVFTNSRCTAELAYQIGILKSRLNIVHPGVSLPENIDLSARNHFRAAHKLPNGPILLSVGRLTERKGIREFVDSIFPQIVSRCQNAQLVVIGDEPSDSLYAAGQSVESIRAVACSKGLEQNIHFLGKRFGQDLLDAYVAADVHIFPVRSIQGDPEGFGMVAIEAAAHGLPTIAYATGGITDAVSEGISGRLIPPGNTREFAAAVLNLIDNPLPKIPIYEFASRFSWDNFGQKVVSILSQEMVS